MKVREGQIWREVDPRFVRHVRIDTVGYSRRAIGIRTVIEVDGRWIDAPRSRLSYADEQRFDGKRGNYALHQDPHELG
jgi:hypothetical protein